MKTKRIIALCCSAMLAVSAMAGCADKDSSSSSGKDSTSKGKEMKIEYVTPEHVDTGWEWSNVEIVGGGFVPNIIYNPTEEGLAYCRTDIGGAYRLDKETGRWKCLTDFVGGETWNYMGIESIATDPVEPNRVYLAAGTYTNANGAIFYSDDYGENWGMCELPFGCGGNEVGRGCGERLQVDPNDNSILYFSTRTDGLWKSTDYGVSWAKVDNFEATGGYSEDKFRIGLTFVAFDKNSSEKGKPTNTIIVGCAGTEGDYLYRSDDAGKSWTSIPNPTAEETGADTKTLKPCQGEISSDGWLYTTWSHKVGPNGANKGAVQKYNLKTGEWKEITPERSYTCGYNGISVDPSDPNHIVCTTLCLWAYLDNLFVSNDGGETWTGIWKDGEDGKQVNNFTLDISSCEWLDWQGQLKPGWWMTGIAINPFNRDEVMYGTGATIFRTTNLSKADSEPVNIEVAAMGVEETAIFDFVAPNQNDENAPDLYSIMGDIYGFKHQDATVCPKEHFGDFKSTSIDCAALDYNIVVRATDEGSGSVYYSTDAADTWNEVKTLPEGVKSAAGGTAKLSADGKTIFYQCGTMGVGAYVTDDFGETWTACEGIPANAMIETDKVNPDKFYAAYDGTFYMSTDKGRTFSSLTTFLLSNFTMTACPDTEGEVWLSIGGGSVYYLDADKAEVVAVPCNLASCDALGLGKAAEGQDHMALYALGEVEGEGYGVCQSIDGGTTWKRINDDTQKWGNVNKRISGDPKHYGRVYISTNGRGIIMGNVKE